MTEYTFARDNGELTAIVGLTGTGLLARTADDTYATRTITGTTNEITVTNGDGVSGNPTLSLPDAITLVTLTLTNDLTVANGGTGAGTFTDGGVLLGSGTGAITAMAVLTDGQMIVGDGTTDPVAESGATLRTSIGVAIGSDVQAHGDVLDDLNTTSTVGADSEFLVGTGAGAMAWEGASTAATSLGLGTGDDVDFNSVAIKGQKIQSFILRIVNTGGTFQHQIYSDIGTGAATNFADKVSSASASLANTTTIDSSTAITSGMGILSGALEVLTFDTAAQISADFIGVASIEENTTTTDVTVITGHTDRNINSVTRRRLQFALRKSADGTVFTIHTDNFAAGKALAIRFTGYLA